MTTKMREDEILKLSLADIEWLRPKHRAWLTQVYRGNVTSQRDVQERYKDAREHLHRIGYRPASDKARDARWVAALNALPEDIEPLFELQGRHFNLKGRGR